MTTRTRLAPTLALLLLTLFAAAAHGADAAVDLAASDAAESWRFLDLNGKLVDGELVLDGRAEPCKAFYLPYAWGDVTLAAKFMVEPADQGVLACGFIARAQDAATYYFVHFDRGQAILCRSSQDNGWVELKRQSGLDKPAGQWHEGRLECIGNLLRVYLNGNLLYEGQDDTLKAGRIGFYAGQGVVHVKDIVVSGDAEATEAPLPIPPRSYVYVCQDAGAGGYEAFPDVCRLADGRLMCVFYAGYGHVAMPNDQLPLGGRVSYCISEDEGRTWSDAQTLYDGPDDDRDPSIAQLSDGRLICNFFTLRNAEGQNPPWTGLGTWMVESSDAGKTWSEPRQITDNLYCSSPVRELSDGRLILGLYGEDNGKGWGAVAWSDDMGKTWSTPVDIDNGGMNLDAETDIIELKDGTLYAAQRGRDETMAWAVSADRGASWTVSAPHGFPGHCPYLLRTVNDIIVMAHRLPNTSLHYSLDECQTWSDNVVVDELIGAYPSMVNLRDGSVLIVYYEEGAGSSIRAKRFIPTRSGIKWVPVDQGPVPEATVVDLHCIWDEAPHNAFTGLLRHKGEWFCVFREGQGHVSPDGALRVLVSPDGERWESAARITSDTADLRDAQITVTPDGTLMLSGAAALHQPADARHQTMAYFSDDGRTWTEGVPIGEPDLWLWRVTWHKGTAYGIGYYTGEEQERFIRLYKSTDGRTFEPLVSVLRSGEYSNESAIVFLEDDTALCLLRRDGEPATTGLLGRAQPPYTEWSWQDLGVRIGGPNMIQLPDGRFVAAVRLYDGGARTALCWIDPQTGTIREFLALPSGGDTSYPGLAWHDGMLWVSYYSSHEGKTSIYLARVAIEGNR